MTPAGFEPTIPAGERPQIYALDGAANVTGNHWTLEHKQSGVGFTSKSYLPTRHCFYVNSILLIKKPSRLLSCPQLKLVIYYANLKAYISIYKCSTGLQMGHIFPLNERPFFQQLYRVFNDFRA